MVSRWPKVTVCAAAALVALALALAAVSPPGAEARAPRKKRYTTETSTAHRGFSPANAPKAIDWLFYDEGKALSKKTGKPALIMIWKKSCHACKILKASFQEAPASLVELSKKFVMISVADAEEPTHKQFAPDGLYYVPRILFVNPRDGWKVRDDLHNVAVRSLDYRYYYTAAEQVQIGMENAYRVLRPELRLANETSRRPALESAQDQDLASCAGDGQCSPA